MNYNIFYSWQSDLPNSSNRKFIESAIEAAIKELSFSMDFNLELNLDRDTKGELGTPDIVHTIMSKIEKSKIFIADISIINSESVGRKTPNPNVMYELGYASKVLGWDKIICLYNLDYGDFNDLPFDLKFRRMLTYSLKGQNKQEVKGRLKKIIMETVQTLYSKGALEDDLNDYMKVQVDTQILSIISSLDKILFDYNEDISLDRFKRLLNLSYENIEELVTKRKFIGFQVFKSFIKNESEFKKILATVTASAHYKKEMSIIIVNLIKWLNRYDKLNSLRQSPHLFMDTNEKVHEYKVLSSQTLNPKNDEGFLLLKNIDGSSGKVIDFGQIQENQKIELMLNYVSVNEKYISAYSQIILEFIELAHKWLSLTNNEFLIDNLNHFEIK